MKHSGATGKGALLELDVAMETVKEAALRCREANGFPSSEVSLWDAHGLVLARPVLSDRDQPPFNRSAMDGYALADGYPELAEGDVYTCEVVGESRAGCAFDGPLEKGQAVAIMTGAPAPEGASAVQMRENVERRGSELVVRGPLKRGQHIALRGEDCRASAVVAPKGRLVDGLTVGVLAAAGAHTLEVYRPPRVAVLATGDELVDTTDDVGDAEIRDSNRPMLLSLFATAGGRVVDFGRVRDEQEALKRKIRTGLEADILVLSGGVSAGRYDLVAKCLTEVGVEEVFHKVAIKPGKPVWFGRQAGTMVFGLPGNPVSAFVTAHLLVLPAIRVLLGLVDTVLPFIDLTLIGTLPRTGSRTTFYPGRVHVNGDGEVCVEFLGHHGSGDQSNFAYANALIRREAGADALLSGEPVRVLRTTGGSLA